MCLNLSVPAGMFSLVAETELWIEVRGLSPGPGMGLFVSGVSKSIALNVNFCSLNLCFSRIKSLFFVHSPGTI